MVQELSQYLFAFALWTVAALAMPRLLQLLIVLIFWAHRYWWPRHWVTSWSGVAEIDRLLTESWWQRGQQLALHSVHSAWFWVIEIIALPISGAVGMSIIPEHWSDASTIWAGAGIAVGVAFLLALFVAAGSFVFAPYSIAKDVRRGIEARILRAPQLTVRAAQVPGSTHRPARAQHRWPSRVTRGNHSIAS